MTAVNYPACCAVVETNEGGFADNPRDPGGRTMRGVTQRTYDAWRLQMGLPRRDVRMIEDAEVAAIYRTYWASDQLPAGLDMMQLDGSINSGMIPGNKWVQIGIGAAACGGVDGHIGPETIRAANTCDVPAAISRAASARLGSMHLFRDAQGNLAWPTFGSGWSHRVAYTEAQALAMHAAASQKTVSEVAAPVAAQAQQAVRVRAGGAVAAAAAGIIGSAGTLDLSSIPQWQIAIGAAVAFLAFIALAASRSHHATRQAALAAVAK